MHRLISTFRIIQQTLDAGDPVRLREALRQYRHQPALLAMLLLSRSADGAPTPLRQAMITGEPGCAELLLAEVQRLAVEQYLTPEQERHLLIDSMDDAALRCPDLLDAWLLNVDAAVKSGRMTAKQALKVVTRRGPHSMDALQWVCGGCKAGSLRGWVDLVSRARRLDLIERDTGLQILRAPGADTSFLNSSQFREDRVGMRELLEGYVDAARRGDIDAVELMDLLREVAAALPSLWQRARSHADAHEHLASFLDAALTAALRKTLSPDDYLTLIAPRELAVPLLTSLCEPLRQEGLKVYLKKLVIASAGGILPVECLRALLLARSDGKRADIAGVSATAKQRLLETVDHLLDCQLIDAGEAARLSLEIAEAIRGSARGSSRAGAGTVVA